MNFNINPNVRQSGETDKQYKERRRSENKAAKGRFFMVLHYASNGTFRRPETVRKLFTRATKVKSEPINKFKGFRKVRIWNELLNMSNWVPTSLAKAHGLI